MRTFARLLAATAVLSLSCVPPPAIAQDAVLLQPLTAWQLDYAENKCRLMRIFGPAAEKHVLLFEQSAPASGFGMTLAGPRLEGLTRWRDVRLRFGSQGEARKTQPFLGPVDKGDSQEGQYLIQGGFWGGYRDPGFDERRGMGLP